MKTSMRKCHCLGHNHPIRTEDCTCLKDDVNHIKSCMRLVLCANCNKHQGTEIWVGNGGIMAYSHGMYVYWCRCCVLDANLKYAKRQAKLIPAMEARKKRLKTACT